jgi:hypothetical protein
MGSTQSPSCDTVPLAAYWYQGPCLSAICTLLPVAYVLADNLSWIPVCQLSVLLYLKHLP